MLIGDYVSLISAQNHVFIHEIIENCGEFHIAVVKFAEFNYTLENRVRYYFGNNYVEEVDANRTQLNSEILGEINYTSLSPSRFYSDKEVGEPEVGGRF